MTAPVTGGSAGRGACSSTLAPLLVVVVVVVVVAVGGATAPAPPRPPRRVFNVGVIVPFAGDDPWSLRFAAPAIDCAVESVTAAGRRRAPAGHVTGAAAAAAGVSLRDAALRVHVNDSRCSDTWGPLAAFDMYLGGRAHVFLGPVCEYAVAAVARYSPHWRIPVITPGALVLDFDNRTSYRLLTRVGASYSKLAAALAALLPRFDWRPGAVGLVFQERDRESRHSRSRLGRSNCFFVMQAVHSRLLRELRPRARQDNGTWASSATGGIWYHSIEQDGLDDATRLREISRHARSKSALHATKTDRK